jgi:hypothetical protein
MARKQQSRNFISLLFVLVSAQGGMPSSLFQQPDPFLKKAGTFGFC